MSHLLTPSRSGAKIGSEGEVKGAGGQPQAQEATRPQRPQGSGSGRTRENGWGRRQAQAPGGLGLMAELTLGTLTAAAIVSLIRLFIDLSFLVPALVAAATGHVLAWACRRQGLGMVASAGLAVGGLVALVVWMVEPHTTTYGLPGGETWRVAVDDLSQAWQELNELQAPVVALRGFVLATVISAWMAALVSDWAAFRLGTGFEATVPSFTMFIFSSALGTDHHQILVTGLYLSGLLGFLLVHGAVRQASTSTWFASRLRGGPQAIIRGGAVLSALTVVAALLIGPALPGTGDPPLLDWSHRNRNTVVAVSPLVDIRGRLVDQANVEVFTVRANTSAYWRLTSLASFDGQVWGTKAAYQRAHGRLSSSDASEASRDGRHPRGEQVLQEINVGPLASPWLPAAFRPERFTGPTGVGFDPASASLLTGRTRSVGLIYHVASAVPRPTPGELSRARVPAPADSVITRRHLALPASFPTSVRDQARKVVAGKATPFGRARALQDWLRANFIYDLNVAPGHSGSAMERFLTQRRGYCEQFAGTFAAMARSVGLPARVAVGFTPGKLSSDGQYHVFGRNAHAWPEVFFGELGWVAFEPTPGRGAPQAQSYTGVPEQQDVPATPAPSEVAVDDVAQSRTDGAVPSEATEAGPDAQSDQTDQGQGASPWPRRLWVVVLALGLVTFVTLAWGGGMTLAQRLRQRRRRAAATTPTKRTLLAWVETTESLAAVGVVTRRSETPVELAERAALGAKLDPALLNRLARDTTAAAFSPQGVDSDVAERSEQAAATVAATLAERSTRRQRALRRLDPRLFRVALGSRAKSFDR